MWHHHQTQVSDHRRVVCCFVSFLCSCLFREGGSIRALGVLILILHEKGGIVIILKQAWSMEFSAEFSHAVH